MLCDAPLVFKYDTNSAIAGSLLGALYGEPALRAEARTGPNLETLLAVEPEVGDLPRPRRYSAPALLELAGPQDEPAGV